MTIMEAIEQRHSVRQYWEDRPLEPEQAAALREETDRCNRESGLHIQLVTGEPKAFSGRLAHYGKFSGVRNYFALIGKSGPALEETCGYYGERLVLEAQRLGLNTCWVGLTYSKVKTAYTLRAGEKLCAVIALGWGTTMGSPRKSKTPEQVSKTEGPAPEWFRRGVEAALLAPTAMNQQKFFLTLRGNQVSARSGSGFYTKMDLGIVKYHFENGAGAERFQWA